MALRCDQCAARGLPASLPDGAADGLVLAEDNKDNKDNKEEEKERFFFGLDVRRVRHVGGEEAVQRAAVDLDERLPWRKLHALYQGERRKTVLHWMGEEVRAAFNLRKALALLQTQLGAAWRQSVDKRSAVIRPAGMSSWCCCSSSSCCCTDLMLLQLLLRWRAMPRGGRPCRRRRQSLSFSRCRRGR